VVTEAHLRPSLQPPRSSFRARFWEGCDFGNDDFGKNGDSGKIPAAIALKIFLYALTRIYSLGYINDMESAFEIIAEPNRRAILSLLVSSEQSVGEIERQLRMSQPAVSKHLRVLRDAGFVESTVDAQRRLYRLKPEPFREVDAWLAQFRRFWNAHVDALERHLDRIDQDRMNQERMNQDHTGHHPSTPTKSTSSKTKTKKRRGPNREQKKEK
jgi:DNA-binding transcriptional ArsR family regulator